MTSPGVRISPLVLLLCLCVGGCGAAGSYELHWTIGCDRGSSPTCELSSVIFCSKVGLDSVAVHALRGNVDESQAIFPCFTPAEGGVGRGPELDEGRVSLQVYGLSPGGQTITGPVTKEAIIPETDLVQVWITLPTPAACNDGVDNEGDGLVDLMDPQCKDAKDTDEAK